MKKEVSNRLFIICFVAAITTFLSCVKEADLPTVVTEVVIDIETISATFNGLVINDGGAKIDLEGFCFGTAHNPTITNSTRYYCKGGLRSFTKTVPFLLPDTYYHVRAFAMNSEGTTYGNEVHFRTKPAFLATIVPLGPYGISIFSAEAGGYVSDDGGTPFLEKGVCLSATANPTINDRKVLPDSWDDEGFICTISNLKPETLYHLRPYAINLSGVAYGDDREFKTYPLPIVTTNVVSVFKQTTARVDGILTWSGPEELVRHTGFCYGTATAPTFAEGLPFVFAPIGDGREFTETLTTLTPGTIYYVRAFATVLMDYHYYHYDNQFVLYGNEVTFTTSQ